MTIDNKFLAKHLDRVNEVLATLPTLLEDHVEGMRNKKPDEVYEVVFATNADRVAVRKRTPDQPDATAMGGHLCAELVDPQTKLPTLQVYGAFMGAFA